ncbi:MAG: hypothetical protein K0S98_3107 [Propionibacteriaceae bacterium]|nr:hypothetical protein [Propionibacteriaceae bacterium]
MRRSAIWTMCTAAPTADPPPWPMGAGCVNAAATVTEDWRHGRPHTVMITTPTGHTYTSSAPQPP